MKYCALALILLSLVCSYAHAQGYRGRDFWICFPQNAVVEGNRTLQLSLYITSENRAAGTISNLFDSIEQHFSIESGSSVELEIDTEIEDSSSKPIEHNALHIVSDQDISVYVVTHDPSTNDSYMAIPTDYLGKEYVVAGYTTLSNGAEGFTPQVTIVGTGNSTLVTIHLAGPTKNGFPKGRTLIVPLDLGETFQIQGATNDRSSTGGDLTGSTVSATKPIAFFTGHTCTQVPSGVQSCNMLPEIEPPANDWGTSFILTKFEGKDYFEASVMANADSTVISINGVKVKTIDRGECYEVDTFHHNAIVTTSKPALVTQYCTGSGGNRAKSGDPFTLIAIPSDRFITEVTTTSVTHGAYKDYLNIVVPDSAEQTLQVDGVSVGSGKFPVGVMLARKNHIPSAKCVVLTLQVATGRHVVQSAAPIAVYSYGFAMDNDNSNPYGHACGMRLEK